MACSSSPWRSLPLDSVSSAALAVTDEQAFAELYRRHAPEVYGMCLRMLHDSSEAEELVQAIFVHAWQRRHRFAGGSEGAWIHVLARNFVLNDRRAKKRFALRVAFDNDAESVTAGETIISQNTRLTLETSINGLSPARRTVFTMHDIEGYSADEIARFLRISPSTVRVHLAHARRTLAQLLRL
jgi:RNA polymerase sigma-70 factor (ECF subfamily)